MMPNSSAEATLGRPRLTGPTAPARRVQRLVARTRAWAPVGKAAALFLLPGPLCLSALMSLVNGNLERLATTGGGLACLWGAGVLSWNALAVEARHALGEGPDLPTRPLRMVSAGLTAIGAALAAVAGGYTPDSVAVFGGLGALGYLAFYGTGARMRRFELPIVDGVDRDALVQQLEQAHGRLRRMEAAAASLALPEFAERLGRVTGIGRRILAEIAHDPRDAYRARRFLNLYLDSAERVTVEYARTHRQISSAPLEQNFRQLLEEMEQTFTEQHRVLLEHDALSLDVEIEVLNTRLRNEGLG